MVRTTSFTNLVKSLIKSQWSLWSDKTGQIINKVKRKYEVPHPLLTKLTTELWRLMQMNLILRSHTETNSSHAFKVFCLNSSFWGRKLLPKKSNYPMDHHSGNTLLHGPFVPALNAFQEWKFSCRASLTLVRGFTDYCTYSHANRRPVTFTLLILVQWKSLAPRNEHPHQTIVLTRTAGQQPGSGHCCPRSK